MASVSKICWDYFARHSQELRHWLLLILLDQTRHIVQITTNKDHQCWSLSTGMCTIFEAYSLFTKLLLNPPYRFMEYNLRGYKNLMLMVESCIVYMCLRDLKKKRKHSIRIWQKHTIWLSPIITWHVSVSQTIKSTCHTLSLHKTQFHKIKIKNHPSTAEPPTSHTVVGKASGALLDGTKLREPRFLWSN